MNDARRETSTTLSGSEESLERVLGGRGSGLPCAYCQELIHAHEIEYEIIEPMDTASPKAQQPTARLHLRCYESWLATQGC
jgi:hypothetical protein